MPAALPVAGPFSAPVAKLSEAGPAPVLSSALSQRAGTLHFWGSLFTLHEGRSSSHGLDSQTLPGKVVVSLQQQLVSWERRSGQPLFLDRSGGCVSSPARTLPWPLRSVLLLGQPDSPGPPAGDVSSPVPVHPTPQVVELGHHFSCLLPGGLVPGETPPKLLVPT